MPGPPQSVEVPIDDPIRYGGNQLGDAIGTIWEVVKGFYTVPSGDYHLPEPDECQFDFHSILGSLGQYPEVLRRLGIILDLEIDANPSVNQFNTGLSLAWSSSAPGMTTVHLTPLTVSEVRRAAQGISDYYALARDTHLIVNGFLNLSPADGTNSFDLVMVDVDGAALKLANFSQTLATMSDAVLFNNGEYVALPALRVAGIGLSQDDRLGSAQTLWAVADYNNANAVNNQPPDSPLYLDDLVRGLRPDILDGDQPWRSLVRRDATYAYTGENGATGFDFSDEGWVAPSISTQPADTNGATKDLLHESLFKWEGWSLAVSRPGKFVERDGTPQDENTLRMQSATEIPLDFSAKVPKGLLPRLRFGRRYRMRVRLTDLAGNSRPFSPDADPSAISPEITFRRFEPLASPVLVLPHALHPSENPDDVGVTSDKLVIHTRNTTPNDDIQPITAADDRFIAPPQTSQLMAEMYGLLDVIIGQGTPQERMQWYERLKAKDEGKFS